MLIEESKGLLIGKSGDRGENRELTEKCKDTRYLRYNEWENGLAVLEKQLVLVGT
jgi:hypothetical protein